MCYMLIVRLKQQFLNGGGGAFSTFVINNTDGDRQVQ